MTDLRLRLPNFTVSAYVAPISDKGWVTTWPGKHPKWRSGFVVRVLWLGVVVRWGYVKPKRTYFDYESNWGFAFLDEEPH